VSWIKNAISCQLKHISKSLCVCLWICVCNSCMMYCGLSFQFNNSYIGYQSFCAKLFANVLIHIHINLVYLYIVYYSLTSS
jgi:hypothetical protein